MALSFSFGGLLGGNDRQLAATKYAGQTSASDTARAARRVRHFRNAKKADAQGAAWERQEQLRQDRWT